MVKKFPSRILSFEQERALCIDYEGGAYQKDLEKKYNISSATVSRTLKRYSISNPRSLGRRNWRRALTIQEEKALCRDCEKGDRQQQLMQKYGVCRTTLKNIIQFYGIEYSRKKYFCNEQFFSDIQSEAQAYFLGLLTADGYIVTEPRRLSVRLKLIDLELVESFRTEIDSNHRIYYVKDTNSYDIHIRSKIMVQDLVSLGLHQRKSKTIKWCSQVPHHLVHHYMRGLFDGDGSIFFVLAQRYNAGKRLCFSLVGTQNIVESFRDCLEKNCFLSHVKSFPREGCYRIRWHGKKSILRIKSFLYKDASIFLPRKYDIFPEGDWQPLLPYQAFEEAGSSL